MSVDQLVEGSSPSFGEAHVPAQTARAARDRALEHEVEGGVGGEVAHGAPCGSLVVIIRWSSWSSLRSQWLRASASQADASCNEAGAS